MKGKNLFHYHNVSFHSKHVATADSFHTLSLSTVQNSSYTSTFDINLLILVFMIFMVFSHLFTVNQLDVAEWKNNFFYQTIILNFYTAVDSFFFLRCGEITNRFLMLSSNDFVTVTGVLLAKFKHIFPLEITVSLLLKTICYSHLSLPTK